jgi:hypothetical protein
VNFEGENRFSALADESEAEGEVCGGVTLHQELERGTFSRVFEIMAIDGGNSTNATEITVGSGAAESVCPRKFVKNWELEVERDGLGRGFVAANGHRVQDEGKKKLVFEKNRRKRAVEFRVIDVIKPLASVARIVEKGNLVREERRAHQEREEWRDDTLEDAGRHVRGGSGLWEPGFSQASPSASGEFVEVVIPLVVSGEHGGGREDGEQETRHARRLRDPRKPIREEQEAREASHLPYRSWCHTCVMGEGKDAARRGEGEGRSMPVARVDYAFLAGRHVESGGLVPVLVAVEEETKSHLAVVVPTKSSVGSYATKRVVGFLRDSGLDATTIVFETDQEPALRSLVEDVKQKRGGARAVVEESPAGSTQSNVRAERAVQTVKVQARALKIALEERLGVEIDESHRVVAGLVDRAASLVNRCQVGSDGETACERVRGRRAKAAGFEFGEKVLWGRSPTRQRLEAFEASRGKCPWGVEAPCSAA